MSDFSRSKQTAIQGQETQGEFPLASPSCIRPAPTTVISPRGSQVLSTLVYGSTWWGCFPQVVLGSQARLGPLCASVFPSGKWECQKPLLLFVFISGLGGLQQTL